MSGINTETELHRRIDALQRQIVDLEKALSKTRQKPAKQPRPRKTLDQRLLDTRLTLINYAAGHSLDQLLTKALDEVGAFVNSPIGFYHFVEPDQETLSLQQWSTRTLQEFCQAEGKGLHYSVEQAGVWADSVREKKSIIHNDYALLTHKKGLPEGHAMVIRELVTPVMRDNKVVAILGVGNKPAAYTQRDVEIVSYLADITWEIVSQKRTEEALRRERDKAQKYLNVAGTIILTLNAKGEVTLINQKGSETLGYAQEEIVGKNWFDNFLPAKDKEAVKSAFAQLMTGEVELVEHYENNLLTKDGEKRIIAWHNTLLKDEAGQITGALSSGEDITERKQTEQVLESQNRLMSTLLDNLQVGVFMIEAPDGKPLLANRRAKELLGRDIMNNVDKTTLAEIYEVYKQGTDELYPTDQMPIIRGLEGEAHSVDDMVIIKSGGEDILVEVFGSPVKDDQGNVLASLASFLDITERKRAEEERKRLNAKLAAKNAELEQIVYVASHDLRSPLVNIDGYSRELEYSLEDLRHALSNAPAETTAAVAPLLEQEIPEALRYIRTSASKMDTLLIGLLRLSRSGRAALTIKCLNMNKLMTTILNSIDFQVKEADVQIEMGDLPPCQSDGFQVTQIFSNLLDNALKYLDPNRPGMIRITGQIKEDQAVYCVTDNGIGIAPAHQDKVFEIFHRLDPSHGQGEGLGLTIIKRILDRLEGTIWVESELDAGSRFYVSLPRGEKGQNERNAADA